MKQGIANIWLLGMIVIFIAMFSAYIAITVNYSKSFKMKNEILSIIEKHKGMTNYAGDRNGDSKITNEKITVNVGAFQTINLYLLGNAYTAKGNCPSGTDIPGTWYGVSDLGSVSSLSSGTVSYEVAQKNTKYYYCFAKYDANKKAGRYSSIYYRVRLFYKFEVPALSEFLSVRVDGLTDEIYDPQDTIPSSKEEYYRIT